MSLVPAGVNLEKTVRADDGPAVVLDGHACVDPGASVGDHDAGPVLGRKLVKGRADGVLEGVGEGPAPQHDQLNTPVKGRPQGWQELVERTVIDRRGGDDELRPRLGDQVLERPELPCSPADNGDARPRPVNRRDPLGQAGAELVQLPLVSTELTGWHLGQAGDPVENRSNSTSMVSGGSS